MSRSCAGSACRELTIILGLSHWLCVIYILTLGNAKHFSDEAAEVSKSQADLCMASKGGGGITYRL